MKVWAAGDQVLASDINANFTELQNVANYITTVLAGETLAAGNFVNSYFLQNSLLTGGGVTYETKGTFAVSAGGGTITQSIVSGTGSNRALVVFIMTFGTTPAPTFNGTAMTSFGSISLGGGQNVYGYYLLNPASGTNNLVYTNTAGNNTDCSWFCLNGSHQTLIDSSTTGSSSAIVSPTQAGGFLVFAACSDQAGATPTTPVNFADNTQTIATGVGARMLTGTSGVIAPQVSFTASASSTVASIGIVIRPINAPVFGYAVKSVTTNPTAGLATVNKWKAFLGVVTSVTGGGTIGNAVTIQTGGIVTGLSGLIPLATYYLQDSAGTIGLAAGTNSVKIGVALSTTSLLLKQDNI